MSEIIFNNVRKVFDGGIQVLNGVNLKIEKGESHIILGQSGGGKSVLIRCLLGILDLTEGDIIVDGISVKDSSRKKEYMKKFSILFQGNALFDSMTILQNVKFAASQVNKDKKAVAEIAKEKLHAVGLDDRVFDLYPAEISGGMQKRAALARAISLEPDVLVFDEPTSGLDPITGGIICNLLKDTVQSLDVTTVTITHDLKVAEFLADRVSLLNKGVMVWTGHADDMKNCGNEFVENFYKASNVILRK
jgi:phospholipid/cholesterol/gamma-HCH transport system ATP-binding protein